METIARRTIYRAESRASLLCLLFFECLKRESFGKKTGTRKKAVNYCVDMFMKIYDSGLLWKGDFIAKYGRTDSGEE